MNDAMTLFDGADVSPEDTPRLGNQLDRVFIAMQDGKWRTLAEISAHTGDHEPSVSAQLRNLRKPRFGGHTVNRRRRGDRSKGLFEYQLQVNEGSIDSGTSGSEHELEA